ncbi:hypothetical protein FPQ18DRAFT_380446 [Pyronema domesticum]|uniref:Uncharacterized protein n=1 Tax=Pyronema omphalodes (strain CBS 100304) TaxID=1076935 RepID=U4LUY8_PYROM|nr:hypothetical protein FPQ18DRAFT_380446 [Pyronema domesticum]CCX32061.1 Similar to conserved hypothetical protein [Verticillium albo-atrum VaMs.102]; acc. no. XP_003002652 [Pyronema omphalodes CBS 100304]
MIRMPLRNQKIILCLMMAEFVCLTTLFGLFGHAVPDTFRRKLYEDGITSGIILTPQPSKIPPMQYDKYSNTVTLYLTIVSFIVMVFQAVLFILSLFPVILAGIVQLLCLATWLSILVVFQIGTEDGGAWWVRHSCTSVALKKNEKYCRQAQGTVAVSILVILVYLAKATYIWHAFWVQGPLPEEEIWKGHLEHGQLDPYLELEMQQREEGAWGKA